MISFIGLFFLNKDGFNDTLSLVTTKCIFCGKNSTKVNKITQKYTYTNLKYKRICFMNKHLITQSFTVILVK